MDSCLALCIKGSNFLVPIEGQDYTFPFLDLRKELQSQPPSVHRPRTLAPPTHTQPNTPSSVRLSAVVTSTEPAWCLMLKLCTYTPSVFLNSRQTLVFAHHHDVSLGALHMNVPIGRSFWIELKVTMGKS